MKEFGSGKEGGKLMDEFGSGNKTIADFGFRIAEFESSVNGKIKRAPLSGAL